MVLLKRNGIDCYYKKNFKSVGMTLAKVKEQDGMTLAKVEEQDGMTLAKVEEQDGLTLAKSKDTPSPTLKCQVSLHQRLAITRVLWNTYPVHGCCMKLCETQLIAEEDYKFARTHTFALLTMVIALCTIKHL